ncbi:MAG: endolytic transglycosylase MltG [Acidiferrobacteraceae bacterium]
MMNLSSKTLWWAFKRLALVAAISGLLVGGYLLWALSLHLEPGNRIYVATPGMTLHEFLEKLHEQGVLPDPYSLLLLAHLEGQTRALQSGEYRFHADITPAELLDQVVLGKTVEYPVTFEGGWTFKQVMHALDAAPQLTHTLKGLSDAQVMRQLGHPGVSPEGRFYPDTYYYSLGTSDITLLRHAYDRMQHLLDDDWARRAPELPLKSPEQALILASLIEKETADPSERALIAGVFINRLRLGMRLQTDPTVIYAMGTHYHGVIHINDLRLKSPYNTYLHRGLPPTPIALAGPAALKAALHPAYTKALYFVARGNGTHQFSDTLQEQDAAVIKYELHGHAPVYHRRGIHPGVIVRTGSGSARATHR